MKKIVVFGGGGYLGNVLSPMLSNRGDSVTVVDTFWYKGTPNTPRNNLKYIKLDILTLESKGVEFNENLFSNAYIVILAGLSLEITKGINENFTNKINVKSPKIIVRLANKYNSKRIIFASSASVYGNESLINVNESTVPNPSNLYSKCKLKVEKYIFNKVNNKIPTCATRSCTIVGYSPLFRIDLVVNRFAVDSYFKGEINVYGGEQMRSCIHIVDISQVYTLLIDAETSKIDGEFFNIVSSKFSILDLANIVSNKFNSKINVFPEIKDDRSYEINSNKIQSVLNFSPKIDLDGALTDLYINLVKGNIKKDNFSYLEETLKIYNNYYYEN
tara:strand:+ start:1672 stop:2664 length:993 start_codon:yes stop_codon:yes gene_type:complete